MPRESRERNKETASEENIYEVTESDLVLTPKQIEYEQRRIEIENSYADGKAEVASAILGIEKLYGKKWWYLKQAVQDYSKQTVDQEATQRKREEDPDFRMFVFRDMTSEELENSKRHEEVRHGLDRDEGDHIRKFVEDLENKERKIEKEKQIALREALSKMITSE